MLTTQKKLSDLTKIPNSFTSFERRFVSALVARQMRPILAREITVLNAIYAQRLGGGNGIS